LNTNFNQLEDCLPLGGGILTGTLTSLNIVPGTTNTYNIGASNNLYSTGYFTTLLASTTVYLRDIGMTDATASGNILTINMGSTLTTNRTLQFVTGDASRIITLSGNPTLSDWFDQDVKTTSHPTFVDVNTTGNINTNGDIVADGAITGGTMVSTGTLTASSIAPPLSTNLSIGGVVLDGTYLEFTSDVKFYTYSTGSNSVALANNAPSGVTTSTPTTWITILLADGSTQGFIPVWT
jgi:hypothetical protein